jgi:MYXO-CTERM domain-containing protein
VTNDDCTSGICAVTADRNFCTEFCDADNPCPDRFTCTPVGDASVCVPDFGGLGHACMTNEDCVSGLCATTGSGMFCTRLCDAATPCPAEFDCLPTSDPALSACSPVELPPPPGGCACAVGERGAPGVGAMFLMTLLGLIWGWRRTR